MPAGNTYVALATNTLGSAAASVTFSSISGSYTDLVLITNLQTSTGTYGSIYFNGSNATNYGRTCIYGDGTSAVSFRDTSDTRINLFDGLPTTANQFSTGITSINNYSNSTTFKTVIARNNNASYAEVSVGLWRSTAAITSITISAAAGNFTTGSTFTLYGIAAA